MIGFRLVGYHRSSAILYITVEGAALGRLPICVLLGGLNERALENGCSSVVY